MNLEKKIEELKPSQLNCNVFDVYSYNGLTMQDLLCQFFTKINECITLSNETIDLSKWLVNEGLEIEVVKKLMTWLNDGTLENIINVNVFKSLNDKINEFGVKLEENNNKLITNDTLNIIYVDSIYGTDSGNGSQEKPFRTSKQAFDFLCSLGSKTLFEQWKIKFLPGTYRATKVFNLPQFSKQLIIEGTRAGSNIMSVFEYEEGSSDYIGLWFEPMKGNSIQIKDLKFKDFKKGFNGFGVIGKNQGYLYIYDCEGENSDCCFAGINNVTLTAQRTIIRNSSYGFRSQYNSACTIGAGTGGSHMSDGGNGCEIYECGVGVLVTRNSVAHSDYVKYSNCEVGLKADMNTRVATLSNIFNNCDIGVKIEGGAEWIAGINNEIDTWNNCNIPYTMNGNGRYTRVQSLYCKNESLFFCKLENEITKNNITNTTEKTEIFRSSPSNESLPKYYLDGEFVKLRIVVYGEHKSNAGNNTSIEIRLRGLNDDNTPNGKDITIPAISLPVESSSYGGFVLEQELLFKPNNFQRTVKLLIGSTTGGNRISVATYTTGSKTETEGKKQLIVYATPSDISNDLKIKRIELYTSN